MAESGEVADRFVVSLTKVVQSKLLYPPHVLASELKLHFPVVDTSWTSVWYPSKTSSICQNGELDENFVPEVDRRLPVKRHAR